jgi:hypothetical protein
MGKEKWGEGMGMRKGRNGGMREKGTEVLDQGTRQDMEGNVGKKRRERRRGASE